MKTTLIINPISGGRRNGKKVVEYLTQRFSTGEDSIRVTTKSRDATEFAKKAAQDGVERVVGAGGDGTVNEAASSLVNTDVALGIIPSGSGNGLARSLNIPKDLNQACRLICETGKVSAIDVGKANERYFFLVLGVGFDAVVGKRFEGNPQRGPLPYFYLSAKEFLRYKPKNVKLHFNGISLDLHPFVAVIANGKQYGNDAFIAPDAKLNDGLLDICIIHRLSLMQLFNALPKLFKGNLKNYSHAEFHKSQEVVIERDDT